MRETSNYKNFRTQVINFFDDSIIFNFIAEIFFYTFSNIVQPAQRSGGNVLLISVVSNLTTYEYYVATVNYRTKEITIGIKMNSISIFASCASRQL